MFAVLEEIKEDTKVEHHATKGIDTANSQILGEAGGTTKLKGFSPRKLDFIRLMFGRYTNTMATEWPRKSQLNKLHWAASST